MMRMIESERVDLRFLTDHEDSTVESQLLILIIDTVS